MLPRTLEPEVMDTAQEARDYDSMDHSTVNRQFVDDLLQFAETTGDSFRTGPSTRSLKVLDVGTGTALIPIELCQRPIQVNILAIDLAGEMLRLARQNVNRAGFDKRIELQQLDAKALPFDDGEFDWVISNSIIHHIPEPLDSLREMQRVLRTDGLLFVRDLWRPDSSQDIESLVNTYAGEENQEKQQLFRQSLHAALTVPEVSHLMEILGWPSSVVSKSSDRHWTICARGK